MTEVKRDSPLFVHRKVLSNLALSGYAAVVAETVTFPLDLVSKVGTKPGGERRGDVTKQVHCPVPFLIDFTFPLSPR